MHSRFTRYGLLAAVTATAASGLFYAVAKSRLNMLGDIGEGSADEIRSAVGASDISFLALIVTGVVTVIFLSCFLTQRRKDAGRVPT
jgi:hypothetical protein